MTRTVDSIELPFSPAFINLANMAHTSCTPNYKHIDLEIALIQEDRKAFLPGHVGVRAGLISQKIYDDFYKDFKI